MFTLDRNSPIALVDQIELGLRALMSAGQLPSSARLLSIRQLAEQLAVSQHRHHRLRPAGGAGLD